MSFAFRESGETTLGIDPTGIPARIDTPDQMVSAMRLLQEDLTYEADRIQTGDVGTSRLGHLATEVETFAQALRRFGWLAARELP
ncbi:hypothetical protein [Saccharopolyspora phatthalungensis]|uniref:Stress response protein YsnF n=1 Tax=Saccharopolyspora phatthalungensis TaxID=664693 RepID=A0A840QGS8_9PSEU|nr:hypothetical protein [Saccharopolyspora phatthalungensis]MBB5157745.1 stress response protein YsnF [Saccharopolyspora phatthalungensis]